MGWRDSPGLPSHVDYVDKEDNVSDNIVLNPLCPLNHSNTLDRAQILIPINELAHKFQERAAIREFDGNQSREEAEIGAVEDVMLLSECTKSPQTMTLEQSIKNAEDILGARIVPENQAKALLNLPVGWKGETYND